MLRNAHFPQNLPILGTTQFPGALVKGVQVVVIVVAEQIYGIISTGRLGRKHGFFGNPQKFCGLDIYLNRLLVSGWVSPHCLDGYGGRFGDGGVTGSIAHECGTVGGQ